jgi:hypothetical protein
VLCNDVCYHIIMCFVNRDTVDNSCDNTSEILRKLGLSYDADDIAIVKHVCEKVSNRAALLVSICEFLLFLVILIIIAVGHSLPSTVSA